MAMVVVERLLEFPGDETWQGLLGVDLGLVDQEVQDHEAMIQWLARQSQALIALLEERAGLAPLHGTKKQRASRLLENERGRAAVRQAVICRHFVHRRRHEALERALATVLRQRPSLSELEAARGDWVRAALTVAETAPETLHWFALWDLAVRVRYREYRSAEDSTPDGAVASQVVKRELVAGAVREGFGKTYRCVDVIPDDGAALIFILREAAPERIPTLDGVRYVARARWIVLRLSAHGDRLLVHPAGEAGARLAEMIVARAWGTGPRRFLPYRPQTGNESISAWAGNLLDWEKRGVIELYEMEFRLEEAADVAWRIQGRVAAGLALLAQAGGAKDAAGISRGLFRVVLGHRPAPRERPGRFTVWVGRGEEATNRVVTYRGHGVSQDQEQAFLEWMRTQGIFCAPQ